MSLSFAQRVSVPDNVMFRELEGESVILDLDSDVSRAMRRKPSSPSTATWPMRWVSARLRSVSSSASAPVNNEVLPGRNRTPTVRRRELLSMSLNTERAPTTWRREQSTSPPPASNT